MAIADIPPGLYTVIAEALGVYVANNLRLNQQNSIGNWLQLFGQAILTFNAQQQLRQQGPGSEPTRGINYELARLQARQPLTSLLNELPKDLLQEPEIQQKLAQESSTSNVQTQGNQSSAPSQISYSAVPIADAENINILQCRIESLAGQMEQLQMQVEMLMGCRPNQ